MIDGRMTRVTFCRGESYCSLREYLNLLEEDLTARRHLFKHHQDLGGNPMISSAVYFEKTDVPEEKLSLMSLCVCFEGQPLRIKTGERAVAQD